jgi:hypothetical protein
MWLVVIPLALGAAILFSREAKTPMAGAIVGAAATAGCMFVLYLTAWILGSGDRLPADDDSWLFLILVLVGASPVVLAGATVGWLTAGRKRI